MHVWIARLVFVLGRGGGRDQGCVDCGAGLEQQAKRMSSTKVEWAMSKLADLRRTDMRDSDSRIYPGYYAPVMVNENGRRVVRPMRYQSRVQRPWCDYGCKQNRGCFAVPCKSWSGRVAVLGRTRGIEVVFVAVQEPEEE